MYITKWYLLNKRLSALAVAVCKRGSTIGVATQHGLMGIVKAFHIKICLLFTAAY